MQRQVCLCHQDLKDEFEELLPKITSYMVSVFRAGSGSVGPSSKVRSQPGS